jgi:hypothetical protein
MVEISHGFGQTRSTRTFNLQDLTSGTIEGVSGDAFELCDLRPKSQTNILLIVPNMKLSICQEITLLSSTALDELDPNMPRIISHCDLQ